MVDVFVNTLYSYWNLLNLEFWTDTENKTDMTFGLQVNEASETSVSEVSKKQLCMHYNVLSGAKPSYCTTTLL
jgi:hypothetical protein